MSQTQKKSGSRDISDLKARLGLKKGGPAAKKGRGGVVAPPGMKKTQSSVPVPPGAQPPAPQMPSASEDPFAAMNAMAAAGVAHQAHAGPDIVVVNDGKPVEQVDTKSRAMTIGKYAAMVLVPLIIGLWIGQISRAAKSVNKTIHAAGLLHTDVKRIRTGIYDFILTPMLKAKERGPGGNAFKINDEELTSELEGNKDDIPIIDPEIAYRSYMFDMDKQLISDILAFYAEANQIIADAQQHVDMAKNDAQHINKGDEAAEGAKPDEDVNQYMKDQPYRYGIYVEIPSKEDGEQGGGAFGARLVEIGPPICQDRKPSTTGTCQGPPIGFGYRTAGSGEGWSLMELAAPQGETVPGKKLLPLIPTQVFNGLIKGSEAMTSEVAYQRRVNDLFTRTDELVKLGISIEKKLKAKSNQSESFTFFM